MRICRDIRFSPDKRPLKENVGIIFLLLRQSAVGLGLPLSPADLVNLDLPERCLDAAVRMKPLMGWLAELNART